MKKRLITIFFLLALCSTVFAYWPTKSAVNPVTTALYVPDNTLNQPATVKYYQREQTGDLWKTAAKTLTMPANAYIGGLAVSPDGHTLYVGLTYQNEAGDIRAYILDANGMPINNTASKTYHVPSQYTASGLGGIAADENYLYATDSVVGDVHIFNVATKTHYLLSNPNTGNIKPAFPQLNLSDIVISQPDPSSGKQYIFVSQKTATGKVYAYEATNTPEKLNIAYIGAISPLSMPANLALSNDNKYLAISVNGTNGKDAIIYDISGALNQSYFNDTGKRAILTSGDNTNEGGWTTVGFTPDNQQVIFSNKHGTNYKLFKQQISNNIFGTSTTVAPWQTLTFSPEGMIIDPAGKSVAATKSGTPDKKEFALFAKIIAPIIESITPNETMVGAGPITATIKGKNFFSSTFLKTGYVSIQSANPFEEVKGTDINVLSSTQMTVKFAAFPKAGIKTVYALNTDGLNSVPGQKDSLFTVQFTKPTLKGLATWNVKPDGTPSNPGVLSWSWSLDPEDQGQTKFQLEDKDGKPIYYDPYLPNNMESYEDLDKNKELPEYNMLATRQAVVYGNGVSKSSGLVTAYTGANQPSNLTATFDGTKIHVTWNNNNNNTKKLTYNVYRVLDKGYNPVDPTKPLENVPLSLKKGIIGTSYDIENPTANSKYRIRVTGVNGDGIENTNMMPEVVVTTGAITVNQPPKAFDLIAPANNASVANDQTIEFSWQNNGDADSADKLSYVLQIFNDLQQAPIATQDIAIQSMDPVKVSILPAIFPNSGAYRWNVIAKDSQGAQTTSSSKFNLTVTNAAPSAFNITKPVDGDVVSTNTVVQWTAAQDSSAVTYRVIIKKDGQETSANNTANTSYTTKPADFSGDGTYTIQVVATDKESAQTQSNTITVTVVSDNNANPSVVEPTVPAKDEKDVKPNQDITINFSESMDKVGFGFKINPAVDNIAKNWQNDQKQVVISHADLAPNTTYTVEISASDLYGNYLAPNKFYTWSFTTGSGGTDNPAINLTVYLEGYYDTTTGNHNPAKIDLELRSSLTEIVKTYENIAIDNAGLATANLTNLPDGNYYLVIKQRIDGNNVPLGANHIPIITSAPKEFSKGKITYIDVSNTSNMNYIAAYKPNSDDLETMIINGDLRLLMGGDANGDRSIDIADFGAWVEANGIQPDQPEWNPAADYNGDGSVDIADFGIWVTNNGLGISYVQ